jgi:glycosyltransferase involved in cell wall biosynthesis
VTILYLYQYFGTNKGSWSTRVYELAKRWIKEGHKVTVVTSPYDKSDITGKGLVFKTKVEGIEVIVINIKQSNKHSFIRRMTTFILFSIISIYYALNVSCQIVIASSGPITIGLPGLVAKWVRRRKLVFEVRDLWPEGAIELGILKSSLVKKVAWWFESFMYRQASLVVACSKGMQKSIVDRYPRVKSIVVTNVSDNDLFRNKRIINSFQLPDWASKNKYFLYAGSLGAMDNIKLILDTAKELINRKNNAIFIIAGDGKDKENLVKQKESLNLKNVIFLNLMSKELLVGWIHYSCAALVLFKDVPVIQTSSPNKLFDAFAAERPIIQNTTGWIHDLVLESQCGINISPNDANEFADAIEKLLIESINKKMSLGSSKLGLERYERSKLTDYYLVSMEEILRG